VPPESLGGTAAFLRRRGRLILPAAVFLLYAAYSVYVAAVFPLYAELVEVGEVQERCHPNRCASRSSARRRWPQNDREVIVAGLLGDLEVEKPRFAGDLQLDGLEFGLLGLSGHTYP
jgi:hypothetical protein